MPSKCGRNGRPFFQDPFTAQLHNPSLTIKTVIHTILNVPALLKFFMATTASLPVAATVWITMQHTQPSSVTDEAPRLCQAPQTSRNKPTVQWGWHNAVSNRTTLKANSTGWKKSMQQLFWNTCHPCLRNGSPKTEKWKLLGSGKQCEAKP